MKPNFDNIPLFGDVSPADREKLEERLHLVRIRQGERIYSRGDGSEALYIIETGWAKLLDADGLVVANLGPGNLLGEADALADNPRELEAEAASDMSLWALDASALDQLVSESLELGLALNKTFGARVAPFIRYLVEERLQPIPFLYELDYEALAEVARVLVLERYQPGSFLFHRGGWARALFVVESGQINVIASEPGGRLDTVALEPGDVIGEVALLTAKPYTFTAEVESNAAVWSLGREDFEKLCDSYPSVRLILSRSMFMTPRLSDKNIALEHLRFIPMFADLPDEALKAVSQRLILRHVPQNELVYAEGSPGEAMYIIDSGEVEIISGADEDHDVLRRLREGDNFGETSLLTGRTRGSAVRATTNTNLWALYRSDFDELVIQFGSIREALGHTLEQELSGSGRRLTTINGEVVESSADRSGRTGHDDPGLEQSVRVASPLGAPIGRVAAGPKAAPTGPRTTSEPVTTERREPETSHSRSQRQTTQSFRVSGLDADSLEREFVPSRQRDEFLRSRPATERQSAEDRKSETRTTQKASVSGSSMRQATVAQDRVSIPRKKSQSQTGKTSEEKRAGCSPVSLAGWVAGLSVLAKLRLLGLLLIFIWLCGITAPATVLWGVGSTEGNWSIVLFPDLFGGGPPAEAAPTVTSAAAAIQSTPVGGEPTIPPPTATTVATDTPVPSPTAVPTDTPEPATATPKPTATPAPPTATATPGRSGTVSSSVVWVRGGPSPNFKAVAKLEAEDTVDILGKNEDGSWLHVELADGTAGWVDARFLESEVDVDTLDLIEAPPTPTPQPTEPPTEAPETPTPEGTPTPEIKYPAPVQTAPDDGFIWGNGPLAKNYLEWESLDIAQDEFYNVTIIYKKNGEDQYFGDSSTEPRYLLPEGLYDIADQHWYEWRVVVRKVTSTSAEGKPDGPPISPESGTRRFKWD